MNRISRSLIGGLCAGGLLFGAASAQSPSYVTYVVVPYPSGGLPDTLARTVFNQVTLDTGQQFVIDNKGGAGGIIGIKAFLSRAMPDGKTLLLLDDGTASINPVAIPDLPYDPVRDFSPIAQVIAGPL